MNLIIKAIHKSFFGTEELHTELMRANESLVKHEHVLLQSWSIEEKGKKSSELRPIQIIVGSLDTNFIITVIGLRLERLHR